VLQDGGFARLGGHRELRVDVRLVAATARDLECAVADGRFREDLFFRLNVICITLPPLRHRRDHIPQVAERLLEEYARLYNRPPVRLSEHTLGLLRTHEWPGNLRELETLLKRAAATGSEDSIRTLLAATIDARTRKPGPIPALHRSAFEPSVTAPASGTDAQSVAAHLAAPLSGSLKDIARSAAREAERDLIYRTLQQTRWNRREAAEILGVSYKALLYKIKEADLGRAS
jgi:two-component system response regulator AtoC